MPYLAWRRRGRGSHCLRGPAMCTKNHQCIPVSVAPPARTPAHAHLFHADPSVSASFARHQSPTKPQAALSKCTLGPPASFCQRTASAQHPVATPGSVHTFRWHTQAQHTFSATTFGRSPSSFLPRRPGPSPVRQGLTSKRNAIHGEDRGAGGRLIPLAVAGVAAGVRER